MEIWQRVKALARRETVFCVSLVLALLSALAVPPDGAYLSYPDYRTLALLFCLMTVVAGARSQGGFQRLGRWLLWRSRGLRELRLRLEGGTLRVEGEDLALEEMDAEDLRVTGRIRCVRLEE